MVSEVPKPMNRSREKLSITDLIVESNDIPHSELSKKRSNTLVSTIVKRSSSEAPRSHVNQLGRTQVTYLDELPYTSLNEDWDIVNYYPTVQHTSNDQQPGKYITEIYDKATKRFIPASC